MKKTASIAALMAGCMCSCLLTASSIGAPTPVDIPQLRAFRTQQIQLPESTANGAVEDVNVKVDLDGTEVELALSPHSIRSADFKVLVQVEGGALVEETPPPVTTYRGTVAGFPGSRVSASIYNGRLNAVVELDANTAYSVQPGPAAAGAGIHVSYRNDDMLIEDVSCGFDPDDPQFLTPIAPGPTGMPKNGHGSDGFTGIVGGPEAAGWGGGDVGVGGAEGGGADGTGLLVCDIGCDTDFFFYIQNGLSVPATVSDIESVLATTEFIYERDTDITYEVTVILVRTSFEDSPYSTGDASTLLCQFRGVWNSAPELLIQRDVAQLFTGVDLDGAGTVIGLAYPASVCNDTGLIGGCAGSGSRAYNVVESYFAGPDFTPFAARVALSAHELGHNWDASHCGGSNCHIMCPDLGLCGGIAGADLKFGPSATAEILSYKNQQTCLDPLTDPYNIPFVDTFSGASVSDQRWSYNLGATISDLATNEPSEPTSMRLNALSSQMFFDDDVRSNFILLDDLSNIQFSYWVQHKGVEEGEKLFVEYRDDDFQWEVLNELTSDGVDESTFTFHSHILPGGVSSAYHDKFRVRFRVEVDQSNDNWFIDDVYVGVPFDPPNDCPEDLDGSGDVGFADLLQLLTLWGPCASCPEDLDGSGDVGFADLLQLLTVWGPC